MRGMGAALGLGVAVVLGAAGGGAAGAGVGPPAAAVGGLTAATAEGAAGGLAPAGPAPVAPEGGSTAQNPAVAFATPGAKSVTLTVCNRSGQCSSITKTVLVLDPRPAIGAGAFSVTPARLEQGQSVLLDAEASGKPPLAYSWLILHGGVVVGAVFGAHATWLTAGAALGTYTAQVAVTNSFGAATASADFTVVAASATRYYTVAPCRLLDTRVSGQPLVAPGPPRVIPVGGACGIPPTARAVAANLTVVAPTAAGFVSAYPADFAHATVSSINFGAGAVRANGGVLALSTDGTARLAATATLARAGSVDLVVDVSGYFAVPAGQPAAGAGGGARAPGAALPVRVLRARGGDGGLLLAGVRRPRFCLAHAVK
jgi:hypothetical protein